MPIHLDIDHTRAFVHVEAEGDIVLQEVLDYYNALVVQNAMPYPKLFDASKARLSFSDDDFMTLGAWVSAYAAHDPRGPIAIVARTDETRDMMRRYMNLGGAKRPVRLFTTVAEGRKWLDGQAIT